ncbi:MAG: hypothetical protein ACLFVT_06130 [Syntrophobacteria bacterium]
MSRRRKTDWRRSALRERGIKIVWDALCGAVPAACEAARRICHREESRQGFARATP